MGRQNYRGTSSVTPKHNNAAGRLLVILEQVSRRKDDHGTADVWAAAFNEFVQAPGEKITPNNLPAILSRLTVLEEALVEIQDAIALRRPDDLHLFHRDFDKLMIALAPANLEASWGHYRPRITDAALMAMELCARELPVEGEIATDDLEAILSTVHDLRQIVRVSSEIPVFLKEWLLNVLRTIERAVELYGIRGSRKLREALATLAGEMCFNPIAREEVAKKTPLGKKLMELTNLLLRTAEKGKQVETLIEYSGQIGDIIGTFIGNLTT
jgi:hypothetical protein